MPFQTLPLKLPLLSLLTLSLIFTATPSHARTIAWGSSSGDSLFYSDGTPLDDNAQFELGSFGSFIPDSLNMTLWEANWKPFDLAQAPDTSGWNSAAGVFSSEATLNSDGTSSAFPSSIFSQGEQAYIWAYKLNKSLTFGGEWALITNNSTDSNSSDDWLFPSPSDQTSLPLDWRLSDASAVIFGGDNGTQGPGDFSVNPGSFDLQLHSTIPEPSAGMLLATAALTSLLRRKRGV